MSKAIVTIDQDRVYTTSLLVAEKFEKNHFHVIRDIEHIIKTCPDKQFSASNFGLRNYQYTTGKNQLREAPYYNLTRDGFTMLAMGFTGQKAFLWKIAYINAFNRLEAKLRELGDTEHRALIDGLYGKHPQWRETADLMAYGFNTSEVASLQGKHIRNVQKMVARMKAAGLSLIANQLIQPLT